MNRFLIFFLCFFFFTDSAFANSLDKELIQVVIDFGEPAQENKFDLQKFKELLSQGANPNAIDYVGSPILYLTVEAHGFLREDSPQKPIVADALRSLLQAGANPNQKNLDGDVPLMRVVSTAHNRAPIALVEPVFDLFFKESKFSIDLNLANSRGTTILYYLLVYGEIDLAKKIIAKGANTEIELTKGENIFFALAQNTTTDLLRSIALLYPKQKLDQMLNKKDVTGSTPLMEAVREGSIAAVKTLVDDYKVSFDTTNQVGKNALSIAKDLTQVALVKGKELATYQEIYEFLKKKGAQPISTPVQGQVYCNEPNSDLTDFDHIVQIIEQCKFKSVDELLPVLPLNMRSNYSLIYKPRGIIEGSTKLPRPLLVNFQSGLTISFAGSDKSINAGKLEALQFKNNKFELREIAFSKSGVNVSSPNPAKCVSCHGQPVRPIWDNYWLWAGVYGGELSVHPIETAAFKKDFLPNRNKLRYQHLLEPSKEFAPLFDGVYKLRPMDKVISMDVFFQSHVAKAVASELNGSRLPKDIQYGLLAALSCNDSIEQYVKKTPNQSFEQIYKETAASDIEETVWRIKEQVAALPGTPQGKYALRFINENKREGRSFEVDRTSRVRYVLSSIGREVGQWSSVKRLGKPLFYTIPEMHFLEAELWQLWLSPNLPKQKRLHQLFKEAHDERASDVSTYYGMVRDFDYKRYKHRNQKEICDSLKVLAQN